MGNGAGEGLLFPGLGYKTVKRELAHGSLEQRVALALLGMMGTSTPQAPSTGGSAAFSCCGTALPGEAVTTPTCTSTQVSASKGNMLSTGKEAQSTANTSLSLPPSLLSTPSRADKPRTLLCAQPASSGMPGPRGHMEGRQH